MSKPDNLMPSVKSLLSKEFGAELTVQKEANYEQILEKLSIHLEHLLNHNFELLLQLFYRIDVEERMFKDVLARENPDSIGKALAELIMDRLIKKVEMRHKYST